MLRSVCLSSLFFASASMTLFERGALSGGSRLPRPRSASVPLELQGTQEFEAALSAVVPPAGDATARLSIVCFTSPFCRKCKAFAPRFERLAVAAQQGGSDSRFYTVNAVANLELFESESVSTLPTVMFYSGHELVGAHAVGKDVRACSEAVRAMLNELQTLDSSGLQAIATCTSAAREEARGGSAESQRSSEFFFGIFATGGAFVRLVAAMGEFGLATEVTPAAMGLAECAVECAADLELGGLEALGEVPLPGP